MEFQLAFQPPLSIFEHPNPFNPGQSVRRSFVDAFLGQHVPAIASGRVLDLGGSGVGQRGYYPLSQALSDVIVLNISTVSRPSVVADGAALPFSDGIFDAVICCEVLEHVPDPRLVLAEIARVLPKGGTLLATVPYLTAIHADPVDYARYTDHFWRQALEQAGFGSALLVRQGSFWCVLAEMLRARLVESERAADGKPPFKSLKRHALSWLRRRALVWDSKAGSGFGEAYTTGFGIVAQI